MRSYDGLHGGGPQFLSTVIVVAFVTSVTFAISAQSPSECHGRATAVIAERERAAAEWPKAVLPQIELAVCYDKAWRFPDVEPAIAKAVEILDAEMAAAPAAAKSSGARPVGGSDVPEPRRTKDAQADYPVDALIAGVTGTVIVEFVIDQRGNVSDVRVVKSVAKLDDAAIKAVRKWKYEPTRIGDRPTEVLSHASIRFGQTVELIPSDQLLMATFYYERGLLRPARAALEAALAKAREDLKRFEGYLPGRGRITPPVKTKDVRPKYPQGALSARVQGTVLIECLIDTHGLIGRARILSKPSVLDAAALNAVLQWEFAPVTVNGTPVAIAMTSTVSFRLGR
jgi:TonB family protein